MFGAKPYRFLCKLQSQGTATGVDFWGPLAELPRLPRVRIGRIILQRARWRLAEKDLGPPKGSAADFVAIQRWRRTVGAPRFIALTEFDKELPVDLDNILSVESLAHTVRSKGEVRLLEWFPQPDELCVRGPEGGFAHELLVPFVRTRPAVRARGAHPVRPGSEGRRRIFAPGSEWLYAKWFVAASAIDRVLVDAVSPLVAQLRERGAIDRWYFVRSDEPEFQLRLRLHGVGEHGREEARSALETTGAELLDSGLLAEIELGTYIRETKRYGGADAFELAEEIFHADSDAVLELLRLVRHDPTEEIRWRLTLYGVHATLVDLGLDLDARHELVRRVRDALGRERVISSEQVKRTGERFRLERNELRRLLDESADRPSSLKPAFAVFNARGRRMKPLADRLRALERDELLTRPLPEIAASLAHMHLNRLLQARHREHELVIYDFLARLYEAAARRAGSAR
jgi:thiopeptide-type bacteriocin biosynthesis protein